MAGCNTSWPRASRQSLFTHRVAAAATAASHKQGDDGHCDHRKSQRASPRGSVRDGSIILLIFQIEPPFVDVDTVIGVASTPSNFDGLEAVNVLVQKVRRSVRIVAKLRTDGGDKLRVLLLGVMTRMMRTMRTMTWMMRMIA